VGMNDYCKSDDKICPTCKPWGKPGYIWSHIPTGHLEWSPCPDCGDELRDYYESDEVRQWVDFPSDPYGMVREFHEKFGLLGEKQHPHLPDEDTRHLWMELMREEYWEHVQAFADEDIVGIADSLADIIYVAYGVAIAHGIDLRPIFAEVHRTNMLKEGGGEREEGRILKPEGWEPPDIEGLLREQGWEGK